MNQMSEKAKLNWLRAAVLGANDGIVSVAALVVGVAGATNDLKIIATAGVAGLVAGALSMAAGEYVSVSTQRDAERAYIKREKRELRDDPEGELEELTQYYRDKGLKHATAKRVALELTEHDVLAAHLESEFGLSEEDLTNPWHAAFASAISFTTGGIIPIAAILIPPSGLRIGVAFASVLAALAVTGYISAKLSDASVANAIRRVAIGGTFAMVVTYIVGTIFGISA